MNALAQLNLSVLRLIDDHEALARLPKSVQSDVILKLGWIERIESAAHRFRGGIVAAAASALGVSVTAVNRYLARFRSRGWRGLVDGRVNGEGAKGLPAQFKEFAAALHMQNQRATTGREVHRQLVERWSKWKRTNDPKFAIPGYDFPPADCGRGYPAGWSPDNILRLRPEDYALAVVRQGEKAAAKFLPDILKTRYGMEFGEVVFFDDQDYDNTIVAPGFSQRSLRPQGFNALEYLSAEFPLYSVRLRWWDEAKKKHRTLTGTEATWFLVTYLLKHGHRTDDRGTTLVVENGTMCPFNNKELYTPNGFSSFAKAVGALGEGKISVVSSGLYNQPAFAGMLFRPQSSGDPDFKAPLEGIFNLVRNRFAGLPGATGRNRDMAPAEQYGVDLYAKQMLAVWERLDDRHREHLRMPLMTAAQFGNAAAAVYQAINSRTDHELEGWDRCGFSVPQFRWTTDDRSPWISQHELANLPPEAIAAASALMKLKGHVRPAKLSPTHVADMFRHQLTKIPAHWIPLLIPIQWAKAATVASDRTVSVQDQLLGPEKFVYLARFVESDAATTLKPGTKLLCYLNPFDTSVLYVCRADGSWLGVLHERPRIGWLDQEAIMAGLHERSELKADMDLSVRPHLDSLIRDREAMQRTNKRLAEGKPVLPEEIAEARTEAGRKARRTAAANRLHAHGEDIDFDHEPDPRPAAPLNGLAALPSESDD
jgi:hypothetical protein